MSNLTGRDLGRFTAFFAFFCLLAMASAAMCFAGCAAWVGSFVVPSPDRVWFREDGVVFAPVLVPAQERCVAALVDSGSHFGLRVAGPPVEHNNLDLKVRDSSGEVIELGPVRVSSVNSTSASPLLGALALRKAPAWLFDWEHQCLDIVKAPSEVAAALTSLERRYAPGRWYWTPLLESPREVVEVSPAFRTQEAARDWLAERGITGREHEVVKIGNGRGGRFEVTRTVDIPHPLIRARVGDTDCIAMLDTGSWVGLIGHDPELLKSDEANSRRVRFDGPDGPLFAKVWRSRLPLVIGDLSFARHDQAIRETPFMAEAYGFSATIGLQVLTQHPFALDFSGNRAGFFVTDRVHD